MQTKEKIYNQRIVKTPIGLPNVLLNIQNLSDEEQSCTVYISAVGQPYGKPEGIEQRSIEIDFSDIYIARAFIRDYSVESAIELCEIVELEEK